MSTIKQLKKLESELKKICLAYPHTFEDNPWDHTVYKVNKKIFVFLGVDDDGLQMTVKLPKSKKQALKLPNAEPTHYGMGKYGWVSITFAPGKNPPVEQIKKWIDESFRAVAPKTIVKILDAPEATQQAGRAGKLKAKNHKPSQLEQHVLDKLRLACLDWPETSEVKSWGHPNFRAGSKTFAVLETYKGTLSLAMKVGPTRKRQLQDDSRFYETPYIGKQGWISLRVDDSTLRDWDETLELLLQSYKNVALPRMLRLID